MTIEPEHGTNGYQQETPWGTENADLWVVNNWIKDHELERMSKQAYWDPASPMVFSKQHPCDMKAQSFAWNESNGAAQSTASKVKWMAVGAAAATVAAFVVSRVACKGCKKE